jgi:hypothetical protein
MAGVPWISWVLLLSSDKLPTLFSCQGPCFLTVGSRKNHPSRKFYLYGFSFCIQNLKAYHLYDQNKRILFFGCREGEVRCVERSKLIELLAAHLPLGTIRFGCQVISIKQDTQSTSTPILHMHDGSIIKAKVLFSFTLLFGFLFYKIIYNFP